MSTEQFSNQLIHEKSPYLLQHAHNPVNWYPWRKEAFQKAKEEDKPIFLSIGYSTCHWCHVMAKESFEDPQVAELLNQGYICIKVDREERPDVDAVYMEVCMAFNGTGGWPLTIVMTPEQKPFWAGTYLPKTSQYGHFGLLETLNAISKLWKSDRDRLAQTGDTVILQLRQLEERAHSPSELKKETLSRAFEWFCQAYDSEWGGFGEAPKFPTPCNLLFLLRYAAVEQNKTALNMAEHTLEQMFRGGLHDQIGGGFSRYSTDRKWLIPHFEKTLYDNAQLAQVYLKAYEATGRPLYRRVAESTLQYVLRELKDPLSGFYCGQDADSDGVEGKYYAFTPREIFRVLGDENGKKFCRWFGITDTGNFEGKSIPNLIENPDYQNRNPQIAGFCKTLYSYRLDRTTLHKDKKVLTAWNGLMIAALSDAWIILRDPFCLQAAKEAQRFLAGALSQEGRLLHRWYGGEAGITGQLDDYAFYSLALLKLYQATLHVPYLKEAVEISRRMVDLFFDSANGGFFLYAKDGEPMISRPKTVDDGALPSGNAVAFSVLLALYKLTGELAWQKPIQKQAEFLAGRASEFPAGHATSLLGFSELLYPSPELVCVTSENQIPQELTAFLQNHSQQLPFTLVKTKSNQAELADIAPFTQPYPFPRQGTAYYLCKNGSCSAPADHLSALEQMLP